MMMDRMMYPYPEATVNLPGAKASGVRASVERDCDGAVVTAEAGVTLSCPLSCIILLNHAD